MTTRAKLGLIGLGYLLAAAAGMLAVVVHERFIDPAVAASASGMYAAGDLITFILVAGALSLVPTVWLLWIVARSHPRLLAGALLAASLSGPFAWWVMASPDRLSDVNVPLLGLAIVLFVFPRVIVAPVACLVLVASLLIARGTAARAMLAAALLVEAVPLALFALHLTRLTPF